MVGHSIMFVDAKEHYCLLLTNFEFCFLFTKGQPQ